MRDLAWETIEALIGRPLAERRTEPIALRLVAEDGRTTTLDVGASVVIVRNQTVFTAWVGSDGRVMLKLFPPGGMAAPKAGKPGSSGGWSAPASPGDAVAVEVAEQLVGGGEDPRAVAREERRRRARRQPDAVDALAGLERVVHLADDARRGHQRVVEDDHDVRLGDQLVVAEDDLIGDVAEVALAERPRRPRRRGLGAASTAPSQLGRAVAARPARLSPAVAASSAPAARGRASTEASSPVGPAGLDLEVVHVGRIEDQQPLAPAAP